MNKSNFDSGVIQVLLERLNKQRLPKLLSLKELVGQGKKLTDYDVSFLEKALSDANRLWPLLERNPEYKLLVTHVIHLYHDITEMALKIEKGDTIS